MKKVALLVLAVILTTLLAGCGGGEESDETAPLISGVSVSNITTISATITWTTSEPSTSQVEYGATASYGSTTALDGDLVVSHEVSLSGLTIGTTYHCIVKSRDASGNERTSLHKTFTTLGLPDTTVPVVSNVTVSDILETTATITWTTDEPATSQVEYGPTTAYGSTTSLDHNLVTVHSVMVTGLIPNTTYHYRVKSKDGSSNEAVSGDYLLVMLDTIAPTISSVTSSGITTTTATITWTTDEPATSQVECGPTTAYGSTTPLDSTLVTSHNVSLSGLTTGTTYHYRVKSEDAEGNGMVSGDFNFTTLTFAESGAADIITRLKEVCASTAQATGDIPETGAILIVWADSGEVNMEIQRLLVDTAQPKCEEDIVFVAGLTRQDVKVATYTDGEPGYRIDYHVKLILYEEAEVVAEFTLEGYEPPSAKPAHVAAYGDPPVENVAGWLAEQTNARVRGAMGAHWKAVTSVAFSPDGSLLASSSEDNTVCLWDVASGLKVQTLTQHEASGNAGHDIAFSPDGSVLAFAGSDLDVRFWDVEGAALGITIQVCYFGYGVNSLAFSPDGTMLATAGWLCGGVSLWDVATGDKIATLSDYVSPSFVTFSPDGTMLASVVFEENGNDQTVLLWDVASKAVVREFPMGGAWPHSAAFSPDSNTLAIGDWDGHVTLWDIASGSKILDIDCADSTWVYDVAFSPDGMSLAFGSGSPWTEDGSISIVDVDSGQVVIALNGFREVRSVAWSPDGQTLAFAGEDCLVRVLDVQSGQLVEW